MKTINNKEISCQNGVVRFEKNLPVGKIIVITVFGDTFDAVNATVKPNQEIDFFDEIIEDGQHSNEVAEIKTQLIAAGLTPDMAYFTF